MSVMIVLANILIFIAISTKLVGCGVPITVFVKHKSRTKIFGVGMVSRCEAGLIVAGVEVTK